MMGKLIGASFQSFMHKGWQCIIEMLSATKVCIFLVFRDAYEKVEADLRMKKEELSTLQTTQPSRVSYY